MRSQRRRDLIRILHDVSAESQQEIVDALRAAGHDVTQATVSRDLTVIGATKVRSGGAFVYVLPDELPHSSTGDLITRSLTRTIDEFAIEISPAHSLVIVKTAPGHAAAVARAIDMASLDEVAGTVAGDDTILVATPSPDAAAELVERWLHLMNDPGGAS